MLLFTALIGAQSSLLVSWLEKGSVTGLFKAQSRFALTLPRDLVSFVENYAQEQPLWELSVDYARLCEFNDRKDAIQRKKV